MKKNIEISGSSVERKLATIEWNLGLLRASVTTTHTPLRTLKSMVETDVLPPTRNLLLKVFDAPLRKTKEKLTEII